MNEHGIFVSDRIWALARGAHAEADPERVVYCEKDADQVNQALGIAFRGEGQHLAVGTMVALARDEDLDVRAVEALLAKSGTCAKTSAGCSLARSTSVRRARSRISNAPRWRLECARSAAARSRRVRSPSAPTWKTHWR